MIHIRFMSYYWSCVTAWYIEYKSCSGVVKYVPPDSRIDFYKPQIRIRWFLKVNSVEIEHILCHECHDWIQAPVWYHWSCVTTWYIEYKIDRTYETCYPDPRNYFYQSQTTIMIDIDDKLLKNMNNIDNILIFSIIFLIFFDTFRRFRWYIFVSWILISMIHSLRISGSRWYIWCI